MCPKHDCECNADNEHGEAINNCDNMSARAIERARIATWCTLLASVGRKTASNVMVLLTWMRVAMAMVSLDLRLNSCYSGIGLRSCATNSCNALCTALRLYTMHGGSQ